VTQKNRTHTNFIKSYEDPVNFKHFTGFKLQSMYNHSPESQSLKSLCIKVVFFTKYAPNGLHSIGSKLADVKVSLCRSTHHPTRISILRPFELRFCTVPCFILLNPVKNVAFWWNMMTLNLSMKTCLHYFVWIVSEIGLHAKCLLFGWPIHVVGKTIVTIFHAGTLLLQSEKGKRNN